MSNISSASVAPTLLSWFPKQDDKDRVSRLIELLPTVKEITGCGSYILTNDDNDEVKINPKLYCAGGSAIILPGYDYFRNISDSEEIKKLTKYEICC